MQEFILVAEKLFIGFFALIFVINISGKGNLAPSTASDAVQNYVLGGIIGGVIYNDNIKIWEYLAVLAIWCGLVLLLRYVKMHNVKMKQVLDGIALPVVEWMRGLFSMTTVKSWGFPPMISPLNYEPIGYIP